MPEQHFPVEALWVISNKHTPSQRENKARENQSSIIEQNHTSARQQQSHHQTD